MASVAIPTKKPKDLPDQNLTQKVELQRLQAEGGQLIPPAIVPPEILPEGVDEPAPTYEYHGQTFDNTDGADVVTFFVYFTEWVKYLI